MPLPCFARSVCKLDPDSLVPVAQLRSLASLSIFGGFTLTPASFESFLRASVQGCALRLCTVTSREGDELLKQLRATYQKVRESLGARAIPCWEEY
jgi:hypothetical protein